MPPESPFGVDQTIVIAIWSLRRDGVLSVRPLNPDLPQPNQLGITAIVLLKQSIYCELSALARFSAKICYTD